jgi:hypothetical protein
VLPVGAEPADKAKQVTQLLRDSNGRILHSTQREGVDGVVEAAEPEDLRRRRRRFVRFETPLRSQTELTTKAERRL